MIKEIKDITYIYTKDNINKLIQVYNKKEYNVA